MCGRYFVSLSVDELREIIDEIEQEAEREQALYQIKTGEVFPTNLAPVLTMENGMIRPRPMIWGFPKWGDQKGVIFNARAETALTKNMFRNALLEHPVVVPTSGFYEWKTLYDVNEHEKTDKVDPARRQKPETIRPKKTKYLFTEPDSEVLYLAGFSNTFANKDDPVPHRFTILTTEANPSMREYHHRMPILLHPNEREEWLRGERLDYFLEREPFAVSAALAER